MSENGENDEQTRDNEIDTDQQTADEENAEDVRQDADVIDIKTEGEGREEEEIQPQERIAQLEAELENEKDRRLRAQAELANFRKRINKQHAREMKYANSSLLSSLISVLDNFASATESAAGSEDTDSVHRGYEMIKQQLVDVLAEHGLEEIEVEAGEQFDPTKHKAVDCVTGEEYDDNAVVEVVRKGYRYHDRILRPPQVIVATAADEAQTDREQQQ